MCCHCDYKERCSRIVCLTNIFLLPFFIILLIGFCVWDLSTGVQTITGRCVWAGGFCLWIGCLGGVLVCVIFLGVNLLAYSGLLRSSSWAGEDPTLSYKFLIPWIALYALLILAIPVAGFVLMYYAYHLYCFNLEKCGENFLYIYSPLVGILVLGLVYGIGHYWVVMIKTYFSIRSKVLLPSWDKIGDRIVLGLADSSTYSPSTSSSWASLYYDTM